MPITITRPDATAPRLGFGGATLSSPSSRLSVVARPPLMAAAAGRSRVDLDAFVTPDPLAELGHELQRIHGTADCADAYVFPA